MLISLLILGCTSDIGIVTKECTTIYYPDSDGDGYGDDSNAAEICETPGYVSVGGDCDDGDAAIHPETSERCDGVDNDCDELTDDDDDSLDTSTQSSWYADVDVDGFGDPGAETVSCSAPAGSVSDATDCDDADAAVNPDADEVCDEIDDDCDGLVDDADDSLDTSTASEWYGDSDGDGYGDALDQTVACDAPADSVTDDSDCDDGLATVYPGADEVCDGVDNDCDALVDDLDDGLDLGTASAWYADLDEDGYGDEGASALACEAPDYYVAAGGDCDGSDGAVNPDAAEVCDDIDNDCDGDTDDEDGSLDASTVSTWYVDLDGDGYGSSSITWESCESPSSRFVATNTDCDDVDATINPAGTETCNGEDDDCDGEEDEGATDFAIYYLDADEDGHGDVYTWTESCSPPDGYVSSDDDCDDADSGVNPDADELCDDIDDDCDGSVDEDSAVDASTWYRDSDKDGYGDVDATKVACDQPAGYTDDYQDCDDDARLVNPSAYETCDDIDNDCDGDTDEDDALGTSTWYADADEDGYGDKSSTTLACELPDGYAANDDDCDDEHSSASPAGAEVCDDLDNDCDGSTDESSATDAATWYADKDGDTYGDASSTTKACDKPSGYVTDDEDCDDLDADISPADTELCNGSDDDCDGDIDEDSAADADTWYVDTDEDGYGAVDTTTEACSQPSGYVASPEDCDDSNPDSNPDAFERCDGEDNDCDGSTDEHVYSDDFSGSEDDSVFSINGDAAITSGELVLTTAERSKYGTAILVDAVATDSLWVSFDFTISDGWGTSGADGITFFIVDADTSADKVSTVGGSYLGIYGAVGWVFAVDTYGNSSGDVLYLRDGETWSTLNSANLSQMQDNGEHSFDLYLEDGVYTVYIDGSSKMTGSLSGWEDIEYRLGVSAATGSAYNKQVMDDLYFGCPD